jgi:hypothetical protein
VRLQLPAATAAARRSLPTHRIKHVCTDRVLLETVKGLPAPEYAAVPLERRQLQLVFRHDCQ